MSDGLATFKIEATPLGKGAIELNGEDVSDRVSSLVYQMRPGQPPLLDIHYVSAKGVIEGEGIVQVVDDSANPHKSLVQFLKNIDPALFEADMLNRMDFGSSTGETAIEVLLEYASSE